MSPTVFPAPSELRVRDLGFRSSLASLFRVPGWRCETGIKARVHRLQASGFIRRSMKQGQTGDRSEVPGNLGARA
eukprot:2588414-Rhodomonas_salina.1